MTKKLVLGFSTIIILVESIFIAYINYIDFIKMQKIASNSLISDKAITVIFKNDISVPSTYDLVNSYPDVTFLSVIYNYPEMRVLGICGNCEMDRNTNSLIDGDFLKKYDFFRNDYKAVVGKNILNSKRCFENKQGKKYFVFNIGDTVNFNYLSKDIKIKVVGFFKKNTSVIINNHICFLDDYIIIPSLDIKFMPVNKNDKKFQNILYSLKNWGYIKINNGEDYYDYKTKVDEASNNLGLKYILNESYVYPYIKNISNSMQSSKGIFKMASIFLFIILAIVFTYIYIWNFNKNKKNYAIQLICGCSFARLKLRIFFEIIIQFIVSFGLSSLINRILLGQDGIYLSERLLLKQAMDHTAMLAVVVMIGICFLLNAYVNKSNIYASIQKED